MNFTDPINFKCAEYSHNGNHLAISSGSELTIYDSDSFTRDLNFDFKDTITQVSWSPDDDFIFVFLGKKEEVHVRCFNSEVVENKA